MCLTCRSAPALVLIRLIYLFLVRVPGWPAQQGHMLAASPAAAATPGPQPGVTPSAARAGSTVYAAYTGTDQHVYLRDVTRPAQPAAGLGGRLIGGPGLAAAPPGLLGAAEPLTVFGRGTDNALWYRQGHLPLAPEGPWRSLGGRLTSGVTATSEDRGKTCVFALGTDNHIWMRSGFFPALAPWTRL